MSELIDREATVKQICKIGEMLGIGHDRDVTIAVALFVQDDKSAFPTVERPHGEWIDKDYGVGKCWATCSECGESTNGEAQDHGFGYDYSFPNFCPNCGADMSANDRQVTGKLSSEIEKLNSEIEKPKSKICPCIECDALDNSEPCRKGCSDYQKWKEGKEE